MDTRDTREKIVIIGGGFAGLNLVKRLDKKKFNIVLVDRNNYHSFPPLFYQIASSGLDPDSICFPFRREMQKDKAKGTRYHMGEVRTIDFARKEVVTQFETLPYDKLIIAAGCTNNFFGNPDMIKYVYTIKTASEAMRCRNEILERLERACLTHDMELRRKLLSFVVVGGGPTGVEIASALGEMKRDIVPREYTSLKPEEITITLLEGSNRLLSAMSPQSSEDAKEYLKRLMVDVRLGKIMKSYDQNVVTLDDGSTIYSESVIWTAGITGITFELKGADIRLAPGNRFAVDDYNRVKGLDDVFAVGDIAYLPTEHFPRGLPQLAQVAIQQARLLAEQINKGDFGKTFVYKDKGSMATIGRNLAVADLPKGHISGFFAWLIWMFIHLISILGMRNKVSVLINWIWAYFTYNTSLRLLLHTTRYPLRSRWGEH
ncbi:MAG: NAD(P)/FAD-dependent oxidoreductase [Bacteroidales bacterium]|nr:NAD(P)/FAD-dependent oxidoreductase [Bacteroidales bacterium]